MADLVALAVGLDVQTAPEEERTVLGVGVESLALAGETIQVVEIHRALGNHKVETPGSPGDRIADSEVLGIGMEGSSVAD